MNRTTFEALRDLPDKAIEADIKFAKRAALAPLLVAEGIPILNGHSVELVMNVHYNPEVGAKTINVHVPGVGPICRLDVDGPAHRPAGRSHKHSLQSERCPDRNLPDGVLDRPELAGKTVKQVFEAFCRMANIGHSGQFEEPSDES